MAALPFVAAQSLQQTAVDFGKDLPLAKQYVFRSFYVDDCLAGANTPQEAAQLSQDLRSLSLKGVFDLRKWRSSSTEVMNTIPKEFH